MVYQRKERAVKSTSALKLMETEKRSNPAKAEATSDWQSVQQSPANQASRLVQANPTVRSAVINQLQQAQGNRVVQRIVAAWKRSSTPQLGLPRDQIRRTPTPPTSGALATTPMGAMRPLGTTTLTRFRTLLTQGDQLGALQLIAQIMERRGEIDSALMVTQAVSGHHQSDCQATTPYVIDASVNGANTIACGCFRDSAGVQLPNPRIRVNFDTFASMTSLRASPRSYYVELAALLHSTLLHEFRHVLQDFAECNATGARGSGICTDCNSPKEMDAYLAEIEGGYRAQIYRHAWVRVFTNWEYLAPEQQAIFANRRLAAEQKIRTAFPRVNWATDPEVVRYRNWCQTLDRRVGGSTRGACDDPLAPLSAAASPTARREAR